MAAAFWTLTRLWCQQRHSKAISTRLSASALAAVDRFQESATTVYGSAYNRIKEACEAHVPLAALPCGIQIRTSAPDYDCKMYTSDRRLVAEPKLHELFGQSVTLENSSIMKFQRTSEQARGANDFKHLPSFHSQNLRNKLSSARLFPLQRRKGHSGTTTTAYLQVHYLSAPRLASRQWSTEGAGPSLRS
jgi:hypothetical protein